MGEEEKGIPGVVGKRIPWLEMWAGSAGQGGWSFLGVCARGKREMTPGETRAGLGWGLNSYTCFLLEQWGELEEKGQLVRPDLLLLMGQQRKRK